MSDYLSLNAMLNEMLEKNTGIQAGYLNANWDSIVGNISKASRVDHIKDGIVFVKADSSVILHFMRMNSNNYLEKINNEFKIKNVNIVFKEISVSLNTSYK